MNRWRQFIDRDTPVPLHYQLRQIIKADIDGSRLRPGEMLDPETELCNALSISRPTVRQALNSLVADGYLVRMKGKGTFVAQQKLEANFIQKLESFHLEMQSLGIVPTTQVRKLEVVNSVASVNEKLGLGISESLVCLARLVLADGKPIVYLESFLPASRFFSLVEEDMSTSPLYMVLHTKYNVNVVHVKRQFEAVNATTSEAEILDIAKNKAICLVRNIAYDEQGLPVEYCIAKYRGDQNKFTMDMYRNV
jgi:GntR family transcriptional regulator